jgi:hypothetical protein
MMMRRWTTLAAALLLGACGDDRAATDGLGSATAAADSLAPATPATPTPADSAIAAGAGTAAVPAPAAAVAAADPGFSAWRKLEFPSEPWVQTAESSEALLQRVRDVVAAQLEEPDAGVLPTRIEPEVAGRAIGILVHPDQQDDSVQDVEFRIHMQRQGAQWQVTGVDRRERCRRGVAEGGLCA